MQRHGVRLAGMMLTDALPLAMVWPFVTLQREPHHVICPVPSSSSDFDPNLESPDPVCDSSSMLLLLLHLRQVTSTSLVINKTRVTH